MPPARCLIAVAICGFPWVCTAQTEKKPAPPKPRPAEPASAGKVDSPTAKGDRLRQAGFLFVELDFHDLPGAIDFFREVAGFEVNRHDGNFVILRSKRGELLLNGVASAPKSNPPNAQPVPRATGPRVEIGIVVDDLDKAFAAAQKFPGWTIAGRIEHQPWGVRDFRVYSPERYYLRITEGPH